MNNRTTRRGFLGTAAGAGAGAAIGMAAAASGMTASAPDPKHRSNPKSLKILVLGGTGQTGPFFVRKAIAHGHEVTLFNRGRRSEELFPGVECLVGNRFPEQDEGLSALEAEVKAGREWDVVLDVWPHIPRLVEATADLLQNNAERYMFVSSMSVYVDASVKNQDESSEVGQAPDADDQEFTMELFGPFKAECENRVRRIFSGRSTIFRPGLIVGPRDFSFRGGYWPVRIRKGGRVLAPGTGKSAIQVIDARDLVDFEMTCIEHGVNGTFNVVGPHPNNPLNMERLLKTCASVAESEVDLTWVPADFLAEQGVGPWMNMPCWLPAEGDYAGFGSRNISKAVAAGLTFRPLHDTIEDTLQWFDGLPDDAKAGVQRRAGISEEREAEVLAAWDEHQADQ